VQGRERGVYDRYDRNRGQLGGGFDDFNGKRDSYGKDPNHEPVYGRYHGDHIFGIQPVRAALKAGRRQIEELIIQEGAMPANKKDESASDEIAAMALKLGLTVREFPKHDLNMLSGSRPHQGFVLRATPLDVEVVNGGLAAPAPGDKGVVLALDEVTDPMNLGALLRTAHFLGIDQVVLCAKNSSPLSPTVSKASAGAMELTRITTTSNMMRFLDGSRENGWHVVGTSLGEGTVDIGEAAFDGPTILVLGNEGHGIRTNVLMRCDATVKLAGGQASDIDSLNVSVTGGILLHHILAAKGSGSP
jgi:21S rRNA (GM2251-2'-O)-methyltransferase